MSRMTEAGRLLSDQLRVIKVGSGNAAKRFSQANLITKAGATILGIGAGIGGLRGLNALLVATSIDSPYPLMTGNYHIEATANLFWIPAPWDMLTLIGIGLAMMISGVILDRYDEKRLLEQSRGMPSVKSDKHYK
jgi:hypothetical protein